MVIEAFEVPKQKKKAMWAWCTVIVGFYSQCVASENIHTSPSSPRSPHGRFTSLLVWTFLLRFLLSFFAFKTHFLVIFLMTVLGVGIRLFLETSTFTLCYEDWATTWGEGGKGGNGGKYASEVFKPPPFLRQNLYILLPCWGQETFLGGLNMTLCWRTSPLFLKFGVHDLFWFKDHIKYVNPTPLIFLFFFAFRQ